MSWRLIQHLILHLLRCWVPGSAAQHAAMGPLAEGREPGMKGCGEGREAGLGLRLGERLELQLGGLLFVMLCVGSI